MDFKQNETFLNPSYSLSNFQDHLMNNRTSNVPTGFNQQNSLSFSSNGFPTQLNPSMPQIDFNAQEKEAAYSGEVCPSYNKNTNYYHEFWRMYLQNEVLISSMKDSVVKTKEIQARISQLEAQCHELELNLLSNIKKESIKKKRRTANEIEKNFVCPYENCQRTYGSDVSLNLHIKLKHGGGNKTEREKLAKMIIEAKVRKEELPEINLNLPPGFFENLNFEKLSKLKDKKDKGGKTNPTAADNLATLKELLQENKINETDLVNLLSEFNQENEQVRKKVKSNGNGLSSDGKGGQNSESMSNQNGEHEIYEESPNDKSLSSLNN